jgi:putative ABC transport system ATP-binding protein
MENVALPLYYQKVSRKKRNLQAMEYLDRLGLKDWALHLPNELSGGQRQRVSLARAMINNPAIILADEPTGNLDSKTSIDIMALFRDIQEKGNTIILVTHEETIARHSHRIIRLLDGRIESDTVNEHPIIEG